ncbi:MAG: hypothetical protein ACT4NV_07340 [Rhodoferax sp.]
MMKWILHLLALLLFCGSAAAFQAGDQVEVYEYGWYAGTVVAVGSAENAGYYQVRKTRYPKFPVWIRAENVKPLSAKVAKEEADYAAKATRVFKVGERVQVYNYGWYDGTVIEVGSGSSAGDFKVRRDDQPKLPAWFSASNIKPMAEVQEANKAEALALAQGPKPGRYVVQGVNVKSLFRIPYGDLVLESGGSYKRWNSDKSYMGAGSYRYNAAARRVEWLSGPLSNPAWGGKFEVRAGGKVQTIYLKDSTIATNGD